MIIIRHEGTKVQTRANICSASFPKSRELSLSKNIFYKAISAGCIIYVVVFEIMQRERSKMIQPKVVQFLALIVGFFTMMTIDIFSKSPSRNLHQTKNNLECLMIIFQPLIVTTMVDTRGTEATASMKSSLL